MGMFVATLSRGAKSVSASSLLGLFGSSRESRASFVLPCSLLSLLAHDFGLFCSPRSAFDNDPSGDRDPAAMGQPDGGEPERG